VVLDAGIPELVDVEELVRDYWEEIQRPWLSFNFRVAGQRIITQGVTTRNTVNTAQSVLGSLIWQAQTTTIDYLRTSILGRLTQEIRAQGEATRAGLTRTDLWNKLVYEFGQIQGPRRNFRTWFDQVVQETTRNTYWNAPTTETLRGMVSKLRWEVVTGSQDRERGWLSGIFTGIAQIPGDVAMQLIGDFNLVRERLVEAIEASQEALWGLLQETAGGIGETLGTIFGELFTGFIGAPGQVFFQSLADTGTGMMDQITGTLNEAQAMQTPGNVDIWRTGFRTRFDQRRQKITAAQNAIARGDPQAALGPAWELLTWYDGTMFSASSTAQMMEMATFWANLRMTAFVDIQRDLLGEPQNIDSIRTAFYEAKVGTKLGQALKKQYPFEIPGPQDLISMYVREGFEPFKQQYVPAGFAEWMTLHGYNETWTKAWWGAHWQLPPIALLYEFYHRFPERFPLDTLKQYLRWHDFHPDEHQWLIDAAYQLIPRIDLRRAFDYGKLDLPQVVARYKKLGYSPDDAEVMGGIAERFALTAERNDLRRLHERRRLLDLETDEEFEAQLRYLEFGDAVIRERLAYVKLRIETDLEVQNRKLPEEVRKRDLTISQLGRALRYGRLTESDYLERMEYYGYLPEDASLLKDHVLQDPIADEQERLEKEILRTRITQYRTLFRKEAIDKSVYLTNLLAMGLPEELALAIVDSEEARKVEVPVQETTAEQKARDRRIRQLRSQGAREQFRRWQIVKDDLVDALESYGYDPDEALAVADYEEIRRPKEPVPVEVLEDEKERLEIQRLRGSEAIARYKAGEISETDLVTALVALGYDPQVADAKAGLEAARLVRVPMTEEEKAQARSEQRTRALQERLARQLYRQWELTEQDCREALLAIPLDPEEAQAIVNLERARRPAEPISPEEKESRKHAAEVRSWSSKVSREKYRKKKISSGELRADLVDLGYPSEIAWLITEYEVYHRLPKPK